jgi:hypothetical protein
MGVPALLLIHGAGESGVRELVRWTARCSVCLLSLALVADGLRSAFFGWRRFADVLRSLALSTRSRSRHWPSTSEAGTCSSAARR